MRLTLSGRTKDWRSDLCFLFLLFHVKCALAEDFILNVNWRKPIAVTNERFISLTLDPVVFNTGDPLNTNMEKSTNMARALAPAYVRLGGPRSNTYTYERALHMRDDGDSSFIFSEEKWASIREWTERAGLDLITCIAPGDIENRPPANSVDSRDAFNFISFSDHLGYNSSWQLGYECQGRCNVSAIDLGAYVTRLRDVLNQFPRYKDSVITGPDIIAYKTDEEQRYILEYLNEAGDALSAITWHPEFTEATLNDEGTPIQSDDLSHKIGNLYSVIRRYAERKPLWIAESKPEAGKDQFLGALVWARRLGSAAKLGIEVTMRQPSDITRATPDYWVSLLHKTLISREVLDTSFQAGNESQVYFYCQCTKPSDRYEKGSVTVFGVNFKSAHAVANLKGVKVKTLHKYIVTPGFDAANRMFARTVLLNNKPLVLINENVPDIKPLVSSNGKGLRLKLPPYSIGFWVIPDIKAKVCADTEENTNEKSRRGSKRLDRHSEYAKETGKEKRKFECHVHKREDNEGKSKKSRDTRKNLERLRRFLKRKLDDHKDKKALDPMGSAELFADEKERESPEKPVESKSTGDIGVPLKKYKDQSSEIKPSATSAENHKNPLAKLPSAANLKNETDRPTVQEINSAGGDRLESTDVDSSNDSTAKQQTPQHRKNPGRSKREANDKLIEEPSILKRDVLKKRSKIEELKDRRIERKNKRNDGRRENQPSPFDPRITDSGENNFYGFLKRDPVKDFPEGDVFLATGDSPEQTKDYDYVREDDEEVESEESQRRQRPAREKQRERTLAIFDHIEDEAWIEEGNDHRGYVPNEFFEDARMPYVRANDGLKDCSEILEAESMKKINEDDSEETVKLFKEKEREEGESLKVKKEDRFEKVQNYSSDSDDFLGSRNDNQRRLDTKSLSKNNDFFKGASRRGKSANRNKTSKTEEQEYEDSDEKEFSKARDPKDDSAVFEEIRKSGRSRRETVDDLDTILGQEMIKEDEDNLKDCQCRVIRNLRYCGKVCGCRSKRDREPEDVSDRSVVRADNKTNEKFEVKDDVKNTTESENIEKTREQENNDFNIKISDVSQTKETTTESTLQDIQTRETTNSKASTRNDDSLLDSITPIAEPGLKNERESDSQVEEESDPGIQTTPTYFAKSENKSKGMETDLPGTTTEGSPSVASDRLSQDILNNSSHSNASDGEKEIVQVSPEIEVNSVSTATSGGSEASVQSEVDTRTLGNVPVKSVGENPSIERERIESITINPSEKENLKTENRKFESEDVQTVSTPNGIKHIFAINPTESSAVGDQSVNLMNLESNSKVEFSSTERQYSERTNETREIFNSVENNTYSITTFVPSEEKLSAVAIFIGNTTEKPLHNNRHITNDEINSSTTDSTERESQTFSILTENTGKTLSPEITESSRTTLNTEKSHLEADPTITSAQTPLTLTTLETETQFFLDVSTGGQEPSTTSNPNKDILEDPAKDRQGATSSLSEQEKILASTAPPKAPKSIHHVYAASQTKKKTRQRNNDNCGAADLNSHTEQRSKTVEIGTTKRSAGEVSKPRRTASKPSDTPRTRGKSRTEESSKSRELRLLAARKEIESNKRRKDNSTRAYQENLKFQEYHRKRAEQIERLKERLREKRERLLGQYREEILKAVGKIGEEEKKTVKRREAWERFKNTDDFRDMVNREKLAYLLTRGSLDDADVFDDRKKREKYVPTAEIVRLQNPRERIAEARSHRWDSVDPRIMRYSGEPRRETIRFKYPGEGYFGEREEYSDKRGSGKSYYAVVDSLENPWMMEYRRKPQAQERMRIDDGKTPPSYVYVNPKETEERYQTVIKPYVQNLREARSQPTQRKVFIIDPSAYKGGEPSLETIEESSELDYSEQELNPESLYHIILQPRLYRLYSNVQRVTTNSDTRENPKSSRQTQSSYILSPSTKQKELSNDKQPSSSTNIPLTNNQNILSRRDINQDNLESTNPSVVQKFVTTERYPKIDVTYETTLAEDPITQASPKSLVVDAEEKQSLATDDRILPDISKEEQRIPREKLTDENGMNLGTPRYHAENEEYGGREINSERTPETTIAPKESFNGPTEDERFERLPSVSLRKMSGGKDVDEISKQPSVESTSLENNRQTEGGPETLEIEKKSESNEKINGESDGAEETLRKGRFKRSSGNDSDNRLSVLIPLSKIIEEDTSSGTKVRKRDFESTWINPRFLRWKSTENSKSISDSEEELEAEEGRPGYSLSRMDFNGERVYGETREIMSDSSYQGFDDFGSAESYEKEYRGSEEERTQEDSKDQVDSGEEIFMLVPWRRKFERRRREVENEAQKDKAEKPPLSRSYDNQDRDLNAVKRNRKYDKSSEINKTKEPKTKVDPLLAAEYSEYSERTSTFQDTNSIEDSLGRLSSREKKGRRNRDEKEGLSSLFEEAIPRIQDAIIGGFEKAQNLTESLEEFVDNFDQKFNQSLREEEREVVVERKSNATSREVFQNAMMGVKKFFSFVGGLTRILRG